MTAYIGTIAGVQIFLTTGPIQSRMERPDAHLALVPDVAMSLLCSYCHGMEPGILRSCRRPELQLPSLA